MHTNRNIFIIENCDGENTEDLATSYDNLAHVNPAKIHLAREDGDITFDDCGHWEMGKVRLKKINTK